MRTILCRLCLALSLSGVLASDLVAQAEHREILRTKFQAELTAIAGRFNGVAGVHVVDLTDSARFGVHDDLVFPQGSAIKIPILLELFRRAQHEPAILRRRVEMSDAVRTGGSGVLQHLTNGGSLLSLEDYAIYMIVYSDNTATNVLIDALGMDPVNSLMASLGAPHTKLQRKMIRPEASARGDENLSTPREAADLMARLARCELPVSAVGCRRVREILEIPKGGPVRAPIPNEIAVAFKPGGITGVSTAWALVALPGRPYALAVMTNYGGEGEGEEVVRAVSESAFRYFSRLAWATPYGTRVPRPED